jgi:hypothetical protein
MAVEICGRQSGRERFLEGKMAVTWPFKNSGTGWLQFLPFMSNYRGV